MDFESLSLIDRLLVENKSNSEKRVKSLVKEAEKFRAEHPYSMDYDFPKNEELKEAKQSCDEARRVLKSFRSVKWSGVN